MRSFKLLLFASLLFASFPTPGQSPAPFSLEAVLSAPFPSDLTAAPAGVRIAWIFNREGERNIWISDGPGAEARRLTSYRGDDGQEIGNLTFSPDGRRLVFTRGGAPNYGGEIPNPTSDPTPPERALWLADIESGAIRRLAGGTAPAMHPTGERLAFLDRGEVWTIPLTDSSARAERLFSPRGGPAQLRWSPDGRRLAFVSNRGDHAFLGVFDTGTGQLKYLAPSVDRDDSPVWSPDGRRLAWLRFPHEKERLPFISQREGLPWSILVADPEAGTVDTVWSAPAGPGSAFRAVAADNQLFWGENDRLVFPYEGAGYTQLWSVTTGGGDARCLTPGRFEVQYVSLTPDRSAVLYSSNQDDTDRQHIWRVDLAGGAPRLLTPGDGIEWAPVLTARGGHLAFLASGARTPAHPRWRTAGGELTLTAPGHIPQAFPDTELVEPEAVRFTAADGLPIHGQLFKPKDLKPGERRPALLFFHGGSRRQMLLGFHHRGYYHNAYAMNQYLASRGYLVLSVNYRSGTGYGLEFREALNYGADGASEYNDVLGAGLYLRGRDDVDPDRIGLWGGSYGGYLTALGLARASDLFAAGVDVHGVHDWNVVIKNFVPGYNAEARAALARRAYESSPMAYLDTWRSPVLLIHGDDDRNVPFSESVDLAGALRRQGVYFEQLVFPDEVHGFLLHRNWLAAYRATADFFDRMLKKSK